MITEYIHASNGKSFPIGPTLKIRTDLQLHILNFAGGKQYTRCNVLHTITHILYLYSYRTIYLIHLISFDFESLRIVNV